MHYHLVVLHTIRRQYQFTIIQKFDFLATYYNWKGIAKWQLKFIEGNVSEEIKHKSSNYQLSWCRKLIKGYFTSMVFPG